MQMKKLLLFFLFFFVCGSIMSAYTKKYRVIQNGIPLDEQLDSILREIEKTHETDLVEIKIDGGYYSVTRIIEIQGLTNRVVIRGSKRNPTIISGSIMIEGWEVMPDGLWRCRLSLIHI